MEGSEGCKLRTALAGPADRPNDDDPVFRAKVRYILESEEQILNPIRLLVEGDAFDRADCAKRQKMIFETSEKFRRIKEEIEREKLTTRS